MAKYRIRI
ncbi:unnamed protein product [Fusarium graminearum]|uniref:Uncharacterized protein n=1 Tax=Gibberella zeae TaxID=5518 RepID=A0A9N8NGV3_GIBZA|nr:unnamed protein product [Fusarium graminearum]CAG1974555.1 unnamed protein product [Fusarium graminearum]